MKKCGSDWLVHFSGTPVMIIDVFAAPDLTVVNVDKKCLLPHRSARSAVDGRPNTSCPATILGRYWERKLDVGWEGSRCEYSGDVAAND